VRRYPSALQTTRGPASVIRRESASCPKAQWCDACTIRCCEGLTPQATRVAVRHHNGPADTLYALDECPMFERFFFFGSPATPPRSTLRHTLSRLCTRWPGRTMTSATSVALACHIGLQQVVACCCTKHYATSNQRRFAMSPAMISRLLFALALFFSCRPTFPYDLNLS